MFLPGILVTEAEKLTKTQGVQVHVQAPGGEPLEVGYNHPGPRVPCSIGQNNRFTTTERMVFRKLRPLIKAIHQGCFPPWNLWAP